jgi:hypothetical protein
VQQPIEQRRRQGGVAGEGLVPLPERQVRGHDGRSFLVALGGDLEEQVGLVAIHRQVADLRQELRLCDRGSFLSAACDRASAFIPGALCISTFP